MKTVHFMYPGHKYFSVRRVIGYRKARIPGKPWFKCFTNRWWHPSLAVYGKHRYMLTEQSTGLCPSTASSLSRQIATDEARISLRLRGRTRPFILGAIACGKAGHYDRRRIPQNLRLRTR